MSRPLARVALALGAVVATLGLSACGGNSQASGAALTVVRLGYFPNLTHGTAIVADREGFFRKHLGSTKLEVSTFNAGPAAIEALKSGAIDATWLLVFVLLGRSRPGYKRLYQLGRPGPHHRRRSGHRRRLAGR